MTDELLKCVEIDPPEPARHSVIWLHGLGASGHDFEPIVPQLGLDPDHPTRFLFPHAPKIPVTINMGLIMPAWYDIRGVDLGREEDEERVIKSSEQVNALTEREKERGIPAERIILAGFSQGGAIALHAALRYPERLAGVMALSTYMVRDQSLETEISDANRAIPVFQAHGIDDPMVPPERGEAARDRLAGLGYRVEWKIYPMQHEVHPEEIKDIGRWIAERMKA